MAATSFGKKIISLRKAKGLTQAKLAEKINVSNKTISRWETGEGYPEISLLLPLAKALGTTADDLLSEEEIENQESPKDQEDSKDQESSQRIPIETSSKNAEEIPIEWSTVKVFLKGIFQSDKLYLFLYILTMASMLIPVPAGYNANAFYGDTNLLEKEKGFLALLLLAGVGIVLIFIQVVKCKKEYNLRKVMIGNVLFLIVFLIGYIVAFKPVFGIYPEDYFRVNRDIMVWSTIIAACGLLLTNLVYLWKNKNEDSRYRFWNSLVIFNKIAVLCLFLCVAMVVSGYIYAIFREGGILLAVFYMYPVVISSVGMASSIIGFVLSLVGISKKQTKGYIAFAVICFVARFLFPILSMGAMYLGAL